MEQNVVLSGIEAVVGAFSVLFDRKTGKKTDKTILNLAKKSKKSDKDAANSYLSWVREA